MFIDNIQDIFHGNMMKQRVINAIPILETRVEVTIVEEDGSFFIHMDKEFIEEVKDRGNVFMWRFDKNGFHSFDFSQYNMVDDKYEISKELIDHSEYPINTPFPFYRDIQIDPPTS